MRSKDIFGLTLLLAGLALCGVGLWLLLSPAQYAAATRIKVENDVSGHTGLISYDPYFIQTTFEIIQSQLVLSNVVVSLNLNKAWGEKYSHDSTLKTSECIAIIRNHLSLKPVRGTKLIVIMFSSDDPNEAADVANAIAKSYRDYRIQSQEEMRKQGVKALTGQYEMEGAKIQKDQTNLDLLRQEFGIQSQNDTPSNHPPEQQPYWDEKQKLDQMLENHKLLGEKIELETVDATIHQSMVQIVDRAEPPQFPVGPDRSLGAALCFVGLFPLTGGILLLTSSRRPDVF